MHNIEKNRSIENRLELGCDGHKIKVVCSLIDLIIYQKINNLSKYIRGRFFRKFKTNFFFYIMHDSSLSNDGDKIKAVCSFIDLIIYAENRLYC